MGLKRICKFLEASRYSWRFEPMGFVGKRALVSRRDAGARRRAVGLEALRLSAEATRGGRARAVAPVPEWMGR